MVYDVTYDLGLPCLPFSPKWVKSPYLGKNKDADQMLQKVGNVCSQSTLFEGMNSLLNSEM